MDTVTPRGSSVLDGVADAVEQIALTNRRANCPNLSAGDR